MMKRTKTASVNIKLQYLKEDSRPVIAGMTGCFFMLFSGSLSLLLTLLIIYPCTLNIRKLLAFLFIISLTSAPIFSFKNRKKAFLSAAFVPVITVLIFFLFRKKIPADISAADRDFLIFFIFTLSIYLFLLLISALIKKKSLFLLLLLIPVIFCFVMEKTPSYFSIGCFLASFLCWDITLSQDNTVYRKIFAALFLLILYTVCVFFLTPAYSKIIFKPRQTLYETVNRFEDKLARTFSAKTTSGKAGLNIPAFQTSFSYEQKTGKQTLSNNAPVYANKTMFQFHCDSPLNDNVYLRGFVGKTYTESSWKAPEDREWKNFVKENALTEDMLGELFSIPYTTGSSSNNLSVKKMSLAPEFSPEFTYLPYGAQIPENFSVSDNNELNRSFSDVIKFSCVPLNLSSAPVLLEPKLSDSANTAESAYNAYVQQQYTSCSKETIALLEKELSQLPVYSSMPENPSFIDIRDAADEIQNFLREHASYNLSLSPVPSDSTFLKEFLYNQHQGFCVHFATAGTLLFRMYGIPARYVSGYVIFPQDLSPDKTTGFSCRVPDARAHAWTEIYVGEGGWVPVEVTPGSYAGLPPSSDGIISPDTSNENSPERDIDIPEENTQEQDTDITEENTQAHSTVNTEKTPAKGKDLTVDFSAAEFKKAAFLSFLKQFFFALTICICCLFAALLLLCLRRTLLFKKRMGYFAHNRADCCLVIFNNILELWKIQFHIGSDTLSETRTDSIFKEKFAKSLPENEQNLFLELYSDAEKICFGAEKPEKKRVRTLRRVYVRTRKKLLNNCSKSKKLYYIFILGL